LDDELSTTLYVAIRTAPKHVRRGLAAKRPSEGDEATRKLVAHVLKALSGYTITRTKSRIDLPTTPSENTRAK